MINYYPKAQFLIILSKVVSLASFKVFFFFFFEKKNENKSCHVYKGYQNLYIRVTMYRIS
jgi:hypothetical protein